MAANASTASSSGAASLDNGLLETATSEDSALVALRKPTSSEDLARASSCTETMAPSCANILMHYGGAFSNNGTQKYDGGQVSIFRNIDTGIMCYKHVVELAKSVGFKDGDTLFYAIPGQSFDSGGIHHLKDYTSVFEMMKYSNESNYLQIYIKHKEQQESTEKMLRAPAPPMDDSLLEAAKSGNTTVVKHLALRDPSLLLGTTPHGNTCLHISSIFGHLSLCRDVVALNRSLLSLVNRQGETPLVTAINSGHVTVAESFIIECGRDPKLNEAVILKQDWQGCNALHHAIRGGHRELAMGLIEAEPALSRALNKYHESPMFMAVMRNYEEIFEKLLDIRDSKHEGTYGNNALHAAVIKGSPAIAERIMKTRPGLATEASNYGATPLWTAVTGCKIDMIKVLLKNDRSLGYEISTRRKCLISHAASLGHIGAAQEILKRCPDAPYRNLLGNEATCLHHAVVSGREGFVEFVLGSPQLRQLINMRDSLGKTALHLAVEKCNPRMVRALLRHEDIDLGVLDIGGVLPAWLLYNSSQHAKTINWNEVAMLLPAETNIHIGAKDTVTDRSRTDVKSLTKTYTSNTSLVAILIATITFAAAFTLPGGYSNDGANEGLPIMGRKLAFQAFLIADTLALCSSLLVAFVCIIARWEDLEFLLHYRSVTKKLMWFAYATTTIAFATGLYTVLAPHLLWLAIAICILTALLPIFTKLLGEWPILKLRFRLGRKFKSEFLDMV